MDGRRGRDLEETISLEEERQYVHERLAMTSRNVQRVRRATDKPCLPIGQLSEVIAHLRGHLAKRVHAYRHANVGVADTRIVNDDDI